MIFDKTIGALAALGSAAAWAFSSILFREVGEDVSPAGMNLGKGAVGILLMGAALLWTGAEPVDARTVLVLGASGLLGIAAGDTFFFKALLRLGPRLTMILGLMSPVITILLAVVLLRERPSPSAWLGAGLTLAGLVVVMRGTPADGTRPELRSGLFYALLSALCMALSVILAKIGVARISALEAALVRHLWAVAGLTAWGLAARRIGGWLAPFRKPRLLKLVFCSAVVVIFGGFWLSMVALKHLDASTATVLNMTEPLFILPLTAVVLKEKIRFREVAGALLALSGVALILLR
jgi:drug/metabolite transporter (DMT)-like permease